MHCTREWSLGKVWAEVLRYAGFSEGIGAWAREGGLLSCVPTYCVLSAETDCTN